MFPAAPEPWMANGAQSMGEDLFRIMADYTYDWEYWLGPDGSYVYISPSCERISGYNRDEFLKNPGLLEEIVHPEDREIFSGHIHDSRPVAQSIDFRIITRAGEERWISHNCQPVYDSKGSYFGRRASNRDITERKKMENALRASKEYLDTIINSIRDPLFVKDRQHRYVTVNDAHCAFSGQRREEMMGKTSHDLFPGEQADVFLENDEDVFHNGNENISEEVVTDALGKIHTFLTRKTPYRDNIGNEFLVGISRDITDRKLADQALRKAKDDLEKIVEVRTADLAKANEALRKSESFLNKIINSIGDPLFVKDRQHRLVLVNDAACRLFDRSRAELLGQTSHDLFPREDADISWQKDEEVFRSGSENVNEETNTYAHGVTRTVLVKKTPYTDDAGNLFLVGVTRDITERKRAEEALALERVKADNERRRLKAVLDALPVGAFIVDVNGKIVQINEQADRIWGRVASGEVDWRSYRARWADSGEAIRFEDWPLRRSLKYGEVFLARAIEIERFDGRRGTILSSSAPVKDDEGQITGAVSVILDITDRKLMEEELQRAKEVAEEAIRAKSEFLANMSHEIRTPMNAVIGMTGLLLDSDLSPEQHECIETIRNSGDALLSVINDILDFSKIESGKMELENQPFSIRSCIEGSIDLLAAAAAEKHLSMGFYMDDSVPEAILGDPTRLRQVLINLVGNAVKFTENGGVKVSVTSEAAEETWYQLHFEVRDTGIGIPPDRLERLFQSFSQVDMSTTRRYGGTGLGLAISKRLVQAMGGVIWVESEPSRGSVFHFTVPAQASSRCLSCPKEVPINPQSDVRVNIRILLAEDNAVNRKVMLQMLRKLGYRADVAADGLEVIKALSRQHYDLVLMDIQMPEMDGLEATRAIRQHWQKGPVIVALTAYALEGDREKCLEAGMDGYIAKPVKIGDLKSALLHCEAQVLEGSGLCLSESEGTKCKE
ncbi:MAG TPA: PAS domain S-box protein [Methanotrichaceae archaeon]|nr:PAS domain S-box protein [Methanotrichaceae archaeon]